MNELIDELLSDAGERMEKSVESTRNELATVRTGRASPHLLDRVVVDYYGTDSPLNQLANVAASDARLLTVTPYDKGSLGARPPTFDLEFYRHRNTVERGYNRLKQWRGIASRDDNYALTLAGGVLLAAS